MLAQDLVASGHEVCLHHLPPIRVCVRDESSAVIESMRSAFFLLCVLRGRHWQRSASALVVHARLNAAWACSKSAWLPNVLKASQCGNTYM